MNGKCSAFVYSDMSDSILAIHVDPLTACLSRSGWEDVVSKWDEGIDVDYCVAVVNINYLKLSNNELEVTLEMMFWGEWDNASIIDLFREYSI